MKRQLFNLWIILVVLVVFMSTAPPLNAAKNVQQIVRFLEPPYYGTTTVTSVFDHQLPLWPGDDGNNWTMHYDGTINGPGARSSYDQHRGIDYALRYELVRAAAPGTVAQAGWASTNHRASYGLHVRIDHDLDQDGQNDYRTIYGHMSVLRVRQGEEIPANADEFQRVIGRSGNTGDCRTLDGGNWRQCGDNDPPTCGAHLHFQLEQRFTQNNQEEWRPVNPYGWIGNFADPWSQRADGATSVDRWVRYPSITNNDVFPDDPPLIAPPISENEPGYFTVDDGDADFQATPNCWQTNQAAPGWGGDYLTRTIPGGNCTATWNFGQTRPDGRYNVFVHIPNDNVAPGDRRATVDAARYSIRHTPSLSQPWSKQTQIVVVDQWVYPNNAHTSTWVYLGAYYFDTNQYGTDYVRLESDTLDSRAGVMAADAVRFAPVRYRTYLPLVMKRWPPIPDTPVLNPINNPNGSSSYTVSWQPAYLASTYTLQEATDVNFSTGVVTYYPGSATSRSVTGKTAGIYYYRVKATNSWGDSGWSNVEQTTVWPTTRTFYSVADTMVQSGYPTTNYGNSSIMRAGYYTGTRVMQSLARFDLSGIPAGMPIGQARLYLYLGSSQDSPGASRIIAVYRVASSWTEMGVTWNTRPDFGGIYDWVSIPHADYKWYWFDVTTLVREWVNRQYTNYGVWILGNESPSNPNWRGFYTREDSGGRRPYLYITYGTGASGAQTGEGTFISPLPTPGSPSALPETFRSPVLVPEP